MGEGRVDSLQAFADALTELERILTTMAEMSKRTDPDWKREFIEMRRQLQLQLTTVVNAADRCEKIKRNPQAAAQLREGWTKMRSALALHQANWPAVKIDKTDAGYIESVSKTRTVNWAFVELARQIIKDIRTQSPHTTRAGYYVDAAAVEAALQALPASGTPVKRMPEAGTL